MSRNLSFFRSCTLALPFGLSLFAAEPSQAIVSQTPLSIGGDVPGSLALVPSVEWPTVLSVANLGNYSSANRYSGYFDADKCYLYQYSPNRLNDSYFVPAALAVDRKCASDTKQWSGNFLNWAATPTIDPFRSALTGGNRVKDTADLTVLQKARHSGQSDVGNRISSNQGLLPEAEVKGAVPFAENWPFDPSRRGFFIRLEGQNFDLLFSSWNDRIGGGGSINRGNGYNWPEAWVDLDPDNADQWVNKKLKQDYLPKGSKQNNTYSVYRVRVQVKVCDTALGKDHLEDNCQAYPGNRYKPQGLLQQYSNRFRYSVFSYLNDSTATRDGGVLRARQSFIGPTNPLTLATNTRAEWSDQTGVLIRNPSDAEASATSNGVTDSGVINYLNKFGSMPSSPGGSSYQALKSYDPVSELYYAALRYFRKLGDIAVYSTLTGDNKYGQTDGFPVITDWYKDGHDPITYSCQKNIILGIGDTNTWNDKNLPGSTVRSGEPSKPSEVKLDETTPNERPLNVDSLTQRVATLEGITIRTPFTGLGNSAFIAGLAYDAHTRDQRADLAGNQTISTYWMDVREDQRLAERINNQYWLAAKYGGFTVPQNFDRDKAGPTSITDDLWWTPGQYLNTEQTYKRPNNFFVAGDANSMIIGLRNAFAKIAQEINTTNTSLGSNSSNLNTSSALFQATFEPRYWSGDLLAKPINSDGITAASAAWSAAAKLDALSSSGLASRTILTAKTLAASTSAGEADISRTTGGSLFLWKNLDDDSKAALRRTGDGSDSVSESEGKNRLDYLRGERINETRASEPMRIRKSRLGDIVNSDPLYIDKPDYGYSVLTGSQWQAAGSEYLAFRRSAEYQKRRPFVVVGANDGMLHAFDARLNDGGSELFAYVPRTLMGELYRLTQRDYSHRYYVDGASNTADAWVQGKWRTLVVGTGGAGGNTVFALDVTDPTKMTAGSVLWELSSSDMSFPIQRPAIVALENGKFGVIVSSGFRNSTASSGKVWILDAANGTVIKAFSVSTKGGLGEPLAIDLNNDRVADRLYVGDTSGNLWRFDLKGTNTDSWGIPDTLKNGPLFVARAGNASSSAIQPITAPLSAALGTDGYPVVLFGTGSYYQIGDNERTGTPRVESYYGLVDRGQLINRGNLVKQSIIAQQTSGTRTGRVSTAETVASDKSGWYLDLRWGTAEGERVVSRSILSGGAVRFNTLTPSSDPCTGGGVSFRMSINALNGSRLTDVQFDYNKDGKLDGNDYYDLNGVKIPYSGILDTQDGAVKTDTYFGRDQDAYQTDMVCYSGSAGGQIKCDPVSRGTRVSERASWREIR